MSDLTITKEKNPAAAKFIETWRSKYQRSYDFTDVADQAIFYEGMLEMARFVATNNGGANLEVAASTEGVSGVTVAALPRSSVGAS
jgi:hypothetical protein